MWANKDDTVLENLLEKNVCELKCRLDKTHPPKDRIGIWEQNETHLAEHRPFLNNVATALRRQLSENILDDLREELNIYLSPNLAPDDETFNEQDFADEVATYHRIVSKLSSPDLPGPTKPNTRGVPYDILEFVPMFPTVNFQSRMERIKADLVDEVRRNEIQAPRGDDTLLGGRDLQEYFRNEQFVDTTLGLILELLALDPGLTRVRMLQIAKLFHSMLLEPWYKEFGHDNRQPGTEPQGHEADNLELRDAIIDMDNAADAVHLHGAVVDFAGQWWPKACYHAVVNDPRLGGPKTVNHVQRSAAKRWLKLYGNWLQILANVELSHTKLTQEELDNESLQSCPVCADDYDVGNPYNCPVFIGCENSHTLCKKCYTQLSLTPNRPYNDLMTARNCPQCRAELVYRQDMEELTQDLALMPRLNTDFNATFRH
ncbi:hypothetical protein UCDDA912_g08004 [Diaporthe ampelina]|uniref:RING-type domain-containing protein n=1 Tax=Diaporthe ampelina TaxID=1214573 RepID=A0A0G2FBM6_9PEZI|nr:hypothetical protein UCDDA912_g08004 [Diaporthe ampelina]